MILTDNHLNSGVHDGACLEFCWVESVGRWYFVVYNFDSVKVMQKTDRCKDEVENFGAKMLEMVKLTSDMQNLNDKL